MSESRPFPHGAKGISLGTGAIMLGKDKLVILLPDRGRHLTIEFGSFSQKLDVHKTILKPDGSKTHTTLFTIGHEKLATLLQEFVPKSQLPLRGLLRPLRPGWMARNRIGAIFDLWTDDARIASVSSVRNSKLFIDPIKLAEQTTAPEFLEDLYELADGETFSLFEYRNPGSPRRIGFGFKFTEANGRRRLVWFPLRAASDAIRRLGSEFQEAAARHGEVHHSFPWL